MNKMSKSTLEIIVGNMNSFVNSKVYILIIVLILVLIIVNSNVLSRILTRDMRNLVGSFLNRNKNSEYKNIAKECLAGSQLIDDKMKELELKETYLEYYRSNAKYLMYLLLFIISVFQVLLDFANKSSNPISLNLGLVTATISIMEYIDNRNNSHKLKTLLAKKHEELIRASIDAEEMAIASIAQEDEE